ncbi:transposase family protein [Streptomyces sp. SCSIO 30461]|uniref:transposase family protein n=1 Tax=Streptomyces sp. SCSIO 30461 TaxID=3118085 RepID=UPI0030D05927
MPADASSLIPPALDQLRENPLVGPGEVPGLLERLAEVPDPRDPRGVRHRLAVVLALTACAVLAGAPSLLAVGEWIADAPGHVLEQVGADPDPLLPRRVLPAETTVRRLLARIDGDALDLAVGSWLADRRPEATGLRGLAVDGKSLRGAVKAKGRKIHLLAALEHEPAWSWPSWTSARRRTSFCIRHTGRRRSRENGVVWWLPVRRR